MLKNLISKLVRNYMISNSQINIIQKKTITEYLYDIDLGQSIVTPSQKHNKYFFLRNVVGTYVYITYILLISIFQCDNFLLQFSNIFFNQRRHRLLVKLATVDSGCLLNYQLSELWFDLHHLMKGG